MWQKKKKKKKNRNQKQYCNKFNKDFKNSPHQKTNKCSHFDVINSDRYVQLNVKNPRFYFNKVDVHWITMWSHFISFRVKSKLFPIGYKSLWDSPPPLIPLCPHCYWKHCFSKIPNASSPQVLLGYITHAWNFPWNILIGLSHLFLNDTFLDHPL